MDAYNTLFPRFFEKSGGLENNPLLLLRFMELAERCKEPKLVERMWAELIELSWHDANVANALKALKDIRVDQARALALVCASTQAESRGDRALEDTLLNRALKYDPNCALAHFKLAFSMGTNRGTIYEASKHWENVIQYGDSNIKKIAELQIGQVNYFIAYYKTHPEKGK